MAAGIGEGLLRRLAPADPVLFRSDPELGWAHVEGASGTYRGPSRRGEFAVRVRINGAGFRDRERSVAKPPGTLRLVLIGDSYVEALQVPLEQSLGAVLENRLARRRRVEVLNFGVSSYGTDQEALLIEKRLGAWRPDLVVLLLIANDVRNNSVELERRASGHDPPIKPQFLLRAAGSSSAADLVPVPFRVETEPSGAWATVKRALRRIRLLSFPVERLRASRLAQRLGGRSRPQGLAGAAMADGYPLDENVYAATPAPEWEEAWRTTSALLARARDAAQSIGAGFVLVAGTENERVTPGYWENLLEEYPAMATRDWNRDVVSLCLARIAAEQGFPLVDLSMPFREEAAHGGPPLHYRFDGHWTPAGHALAARCIGDWLEAGPWLAKPTL